MPNFKQAPKLLHNKNKYESNNYYNLPQELMDSVFTQLDGKCGNQIKLIVVLLGTLGNGTFGVSEKWICDRTGMVQQTYSKARQALAQRGWIYAENGKLFVLPKIIKEGINYPPACVLEEDREKYFQKTISNCVNEIKAQYQNNQGQFENVPSGQYDIEYNKIKNKNNNETSRRIENASRQPIKEEFHF